jgi:hypothetical protein
MPHVRILLQGNMWDGRGWTHLVNEGSDHFKSWEFGGEVLDSFGAGNQVQKQDMVLRDAPGFEDLHGHDG